MAITPGAAPSRIFHGWWVTLALGITVFLGASDLTCGYGTTFSVAGGR